MRLAGGESGMIAIIETLSTFRIQEAAQGFLMLPLAASFARFIFDHPSRLRLADAFAGVCFDRFGH